MPLTRKFIDFACWYTYATAKFETTVITIAALIYLAAMTIQRNKKTTKNAESEVNVCNTFVTGANSSPNYFFF